MNIENRNEFNQNYFANSNPQPDEHNVIEIKNLYDRPAVLQNSNDFQKTIKSEQATQQKKSTIKLQVLINFVFLCAMAATIQVAIPIPIFSEIFSPQPPSALSADYVFNSVTANHYSISYSLTINNVDDISSQNYSLVVVKSANDNQEFVSSIPTALLSTHQALQVETL